MIVDYTLFEIINFIAILLYLEVTFLSTKEINL